MAHKEALLTIKDLSRGYPENPEKVFDNFHFTLLHGQFHVLMGKSGAGKTTLTRLITRELTPQTASIYYRGEDIAKYDQQDIEAYRKKLGIVFQDYRLFDQASVRENVGYPLQIFGLGETIIETKTDKMLAKMGIKILAERSIRLLSAGEKQKVCLARALIHEPEFIIADEPTGNLDREQTQEVANMLIQANTSGTTIFLITHDIHLVHYLKEKHPIILDILK